MATHKLRTADGRRTSCQAAHRGGAGASIGDRNGDRPSAWCLNCSLYINDVLWWISLGRHFNAAVSLISCKMLRQNDGRSTTRTSFCGRTSPSPHGFLGNIFDVMLQVGNTYNPWNLRFPSNLYAPIPIPAAVCLVLWMIESTKSCMQLISRCIDFCHWFWGEISGRRQLKAHATSSFTRGVASSMDSWILSDWD